MSGVKCDHCGREVSFKKGDVWINDNGFKVKILDWGFNSVWVYYITNKNKCSWGFEEFLRNYTKE